MIRATMVSVMKTLRTIGFAAGASLAASAAFGQSAATDGEVIRIDRTAGKITIEHGPLKQFDMDEGMTMVYRADDPAMLQNLKAGDKIKFTVERTNGQFTVSKIERVR